MLGLAASVAFAGSVILAALRLLIRRDNIHRRSYIFVTRTFCYYLFIHGVAALVPFPVYWFWPTDISPLFNASPWFVAVLSPFFVNRLLRLQGLDFPDATGPLSRFADDLWRDVVQRLADEQQAAMLRRVAPYADGITFFEARALALAYIPLEFNERQREALRKAIDAASTAEQVMELYIRHVGMSSFRIVFRKKKEKELAQLLLFPDSAARS